MNNILGTNKENLCDFVEDDYIKAEPSLPADKIRDRVKHVIFENQRVKKAVEILEQGDLMGFGEMLKEAHISLRDLYEVTGFELDTMFDVACQTEGCIGSRMTGGGFGGCTVSLVKDEAIENFKAFVSAEYEKKTGLKADFYVAEIGDGVMKV